MFIFHFHNDFDIIFFDFSHSPLELQFYTSVAATVVQVPFWFFFVVSVNFFFDTLDTMKLRGNLQVHPYMRQFVVINQFITFLKQGENVCYIEMFVSNNFSLYRLCN